MTWKILFFIKVRVRGYTKCLQIIVSSLKYGQGIGIALVTPFLIFTAIVEIAIFWFLIIILIYIMGLPLSRWLCSQHISSHTSISTKLKFHSQKFIMCPFMDKMLNSCSSIEA